MDNKNEKSTDVTLETVKLPAVLEYFHAPKVIDFLSLDVEGGEYAAMKGMNGFWEQYTFLTIVIERPVKKLHMLLIEHDYWFERVLNSWGDVLYIHSSTPGFGQGIKHKKTKFGGSAHSFLLINASSVHPIVS